MIEVEGLRKEYTGKSALEGFTLHVDEGECCGLVGPNGAGKTTLIKILATLLPRDAGIARVGGRDVTREAGKVRAFIGYLPDVAGLYQEMRVDELLHFYAEAFRLSGEARKLAVERALQRSGLTERRKSFVEELSLGMKQRLLLAKTLLHEPKVLLLDEPATGLDPLARAELRGQLQDLHREGITILVSSHILADLEDICTRVALIADGRNASDAAGRTVIPMAAAAGNTMLCDIEFSGEGSEAVRALEGFSAARVLDAAPGGVRVEVAGGAEKACGLLRHLLDRGVVITRFDTRGPGLEEQYRKIFERRTE